MVSGLLLLAVSVIWPRLIDDDRVWSPEQAHEHAQAAASLHQLTHEAAEAQLNDRASEAEKARRRAELQAAEQRYNTSNEQLEWAKQVRGGGTAADVIWWLAIALLIIGAVRHFALQSDSGRR